MENGPIENLVSFRISAMDTLLYCSSVNTFLIKMSARSDKYLRMNQIRKALETEVRSFNELVAIVYGAKANESDRRKLHFDLTGLRLLGLIMFDRTTYSSLETKIRYNNDAEYQVTLKHSRRLMLGTKELSGYGNENPQTLLNRLTNEIGKKVTRIPNYFIDHLKTGYYPDIYRHLLRYNEIEEKYPKINALLKYREGISGVEIVPSWKDEEVVEVHPDDAIFKGPNGIPDSLLYDAESINGTKIGRKNLSYAKVQRQGVPIIVRRVKHKNKTVVFKEVLNNPDIVKEYITLKYDVPIKIYGLLGQVENGIPLDGYCDACPLRHITITKKS